MLLVCRLLTEVTQQPLRLKQRVPPPRARPAFDRVPTRRGKPQALTYRLCAEGIVRSGLVTALTQEEKKKPLKDKELPQAASARGRTYVMYPVRLGSPKLLPCFGRKEKTPIPKTRFSIWTLLRTPGRFTTRPLPVCFTTKMSVVRQIGP